MKINIQQSGFTVLEVLLAIVIFSFGAVALALMQTSSFQGNDRANIGSEATTVAGDKLEELMSLAFTDPNSLNDSNGDGGAGLAAEDAAADHQETPLGTQGNYTIFWNVADITVPPSTTTNAKQVTIIVRWVGTDARQHRVVMNTIKPELGG